MCEQGFSEVGGARMLARSICLRTLPLSEARRSRFRCQPSLTDIHNTIPCSELNEMNFEYLIDERMNFKCDDRRKKTIPSEVQPNTHEHQA